MGAGAPAKSSCAVRMPRPSPKKSPAASMACHLHAPRGAPVSGTRVCSCLRSTQGRRAWGQGARVPAADGKVLARGRGEGGPACSRPVASGTQASWGLTDRHKLAGAAGPCTRTRWSGARRGAEGAVPSGPHRPGLLIAGQRRLRPSWPLTGTLDRVAAKKISRRAQGRGLRDKGAARLCACGQTRAGARTGSRGSAAIERPRSPPWSWP